MKDKARKEGVKVESYDYGRDFKKLSPAEKGGILKTAKHLLKVQKEDAERVANVGSLKNEGKKRV
jgi:hypothetical protein